MEAMSLGQAIWIGACQILSAVFPGNFALDVYYRGWTISGHVASLSLGVFFLPIDSRPWWQLRAMIC